MPSEATRARLLPTFECSQALHFVLVMFIIAARVEGGSAAGEFMVMHYEN
jgi:hypothetical protein